MVIRSVAAPATLAAAEFRQEPNFLYFTGNDRLLGGVLVLDGSAHRAELFVPTRLPPSLEWYAPHQPGPSTLSPTSVHVDQVSDWRAFSAYMDERLARATHPVIYVDQGADSFTGRLGTPLDSLATLGNPWRAWWQMLERRWPGATVRGGGEMLDDIRAIKDSIEVATLRRVGLATASAFRAGLGHFSPGKRQREVEAAVVDACVRIGGSGPSFWPWAMAGPNAAFSAPFASLADPNHLDRVMQSGEVALFDIGCRVDHYMGDVGRTVPVSGRFTSDQAEVIDLLVATYRAGLATMRDGATTSAVIRASIAEVEHRQPTLRSALAKNAAVVITRPDGIPYWQIHGVGLSAAEGLPDTLRSGMVLDYEPIFVVDGQGFYMEDMILVTPNGVEVLTKGLPYTASEIERAMGRPILGHPSP